MSSRKRNFMGGGGLSAAINSTTTNKDMEEVGGGKLTHELSKSLNDLLLHNKNNSTTTTVEDGLQKEDDVYHKFLNSPPNKNSTATDDDNQIQQQWQKDGQKWLLSAMSKMGVGTNINTLKFWKEHGRVNDMEKFADGRYLVWFVKEIVLGLATTNNNEGGEQTTVVQDNNDSDDNFGHHLMGALQQFHSSIIQLLETTSSSNNTTKEDNTHHNIFGDDPNNNAEEYTAGVMWQMLLQNVHLTPDSLRDALETFSSPQEYYEQQSSGVSLDSYNNSNEADIRGEYYAWPSFFRYATLKAAEDNHSSQEYGNSDGDYSSNKRRRSNNSKALHIMGGGAGAGAGAGEGKNNHDWLSLLGYAITYAFLSSPINDMTVMQKMTYLKDNILDSLPNMMNIPNFDYNTKNSLLSGIIACVLDEVAEWIVLDGLALGDDDDDSSEEISPEGRMNVEVCDKLRATLGQIVDLFLVDGVLTKLGKLTRTPQANMVAEVADALLSYSHVHHGLRNSSSIDDDDNSSYPLDKRLTSDAMQVVQFIKNGCPQLNQQLNCRKFTPGHYYSSSEGIDSGAPLHPIVIYTRALLVSNNLSQASKVCRSLEDCSGIEDATKEHCYFLLFEKFQDVGVLFEDGWNTISGATLANITLGALGLRCVKRYLENIVVEAQEALLSKPKSRLKRKERAKQELLCVKDAVRRTILKFLLPRAYSPREALLTANDLSFASRSPQLEKTGERGNETTVDTVYHILAAPSLYSVWNENMGSEEEEEDAVVDYEEKSKGIDLVQEVEFALEESEQIKEVTREEHREEPVSKEEVASENEVIDLEDSDDESGSGVVQEPPIQQQPDAKSHEKDDEEQQNDITYPHHYHEFAGNYSESDDYDVEDDEEADRHIAYEGVYDNEEGRGDSDSEGRAVDSLDSDGPNEEQIDDLIEILESSEEEEREEEEDVQEMMSQGEEDEPSEGEQSDETDKLNKAVDDYIGERGESEEDEDTPVVVDSREREAKILSEAVHEYYNPSTLGVETEPKEDVEPTEEGTDIDILADDEHESIDTEEDRRSISQYGEVEQASDGIKEDKIENEEIVDEETMIEEEGKDENEGEKPSVLVAAAMSTQRQGDAGNFDQSSTPNRFELPPARSGAEEEEPSVDDNFSFDNTSAAMASTDALSYSQTDDGYVPDAEVSEVERADRAKKDAARKKAIDDGYIPDAETSEVEQAKEVKIVHGKNKRDTVRFEEANLETTIQSATTTASIDLAASQSIDEGYLPDESEVERGETLRRRISNIDKGYLPDSLVMTEEEHGGDDIAGGEARDDDQKKLPHEEEALEESKQEASSQVEQEIAVPADTRLDDTIDEGYLPSAGEQELSEKEDLTTTIAITHGEGKLEALQEPVKKDSIAVKEAADEASLQEAAKKDVLEVKQKEAVDSSQAIAAKLLNSPHQDSVTTGEIKETAGGALSSSPASGKDNELKPAVEAKMTDTNATNLQQQQDLSRLTVAQLKDKLRELNLPVSGRKQELIDRIIGHVTLKAVSLPTSQTKPAASKLPSVSSLTSTGIKFDREAVSKPSPPPFNAAAPQEGYDPMLASLSELAPDSLIMDAVDLTATVPGIDSQSIQQEDFKLAATQDLAPAPSMDASLQTAHFTEHITEMDETIMSAEESKVSPTIKSDGKSPASSSKNKSSLEAAEKGSWECYKCDHINAPSRTRCQGCMGWKGGHRSPSKKKKSLTFADQKRTVEASESKPRKRKASSSETASESNSSPTRKSRRERKPSLKAAEELQDTPISELSHPVDSETEDEGSVDESKASSKTSSGVPTSIITKSKGGKKSAAPLPAVPEGEAVEEDGNATMVSLKKAPADEEEEERESSKSTRAKRSTRQAKTKTAASTTSVSTRSSRRVTASKEKAADTKDEVTSKRSTKSSRQSTAAVESSEKTSSPPKRGRGRPRKVPKTDEKATTKDAQEEKEVSKKTEEATKSMASVSTRASRRGASSKETSKVVEKKKATESDEEETKEAKGMWKCHKCDHPNAPERARCKECFGWKGGHRSPSKKGDSSITSSRRRTRKVKKEALADESVGTRRSTRSRAKK